MHPLLLLFRYAKNYRSQGWWAVFWTIINKICDLAPSFLIGVAVDVVIKRKNSFIASMGIEDTVIQLGILSFFTLLIWGTESLSEFLYTKAWRNLAQSLQHDLRLTAYYHLQELELAYFEERSTGLLLSILNDDINQLERFLNTGATDIIQFLTTVICVGVVFVLIAPIVAILAMIPIPFIFWGTIKFQQRLEPLYEDVREMNSLINSRLANNITGIATIKSFTTENYEGERVKKESNSYRYSNGKAIALSSAIVPVIRFGVVAGFIATLFFGGIAVLRDQLSVGTYGFMVFIVQFLLWPFAFLGEVLDEYQRAMASILRVMELLKTPIAIYSGSRRLKGVKGEISLQNINFAYPDRPVVLKNLSMDIPAHSSIGIAGATGSGKSTLVKLLMRFYEPQSGTIEIDGINIQEIHLQDLRQAIGWVSQDVFLFHGTVAENIAYGTFNATFAEIVQAAKLAECHSFIQELPQQYDTIVGERGQKLSGGQRQRLAIARAILKNPPILILDEATSAVDNETEQAIQKSLQFITQNRTTISIAHRLSTIRNCDRIYVMEKGEITEAGTHEELIHQQGIYAKLWNVQSGIIDQINLQGNNLHLGPALE